jgi:hypothetical protein
MATPIPCKTRKEISMMPELARPEKKDANVKITMPPTKIFFLPYMSAILPKGTRRTAEDRRYAVATQPNVTASNDRSLPIRGRAILTEETMKGKGKKVSVAIRSIALFGASLLTGSSTIGHYN